MFKNPRVLRNIAVGTGALVTATAIKQIAFFVNRVEDNEMGPELVTDDWVISFKGIDHQELKQKIGLIHEPISKKFMFRRIVGMPGDWIRESGSNIIISVPNGCLYVESDEETKQNVIKQQSMFDEDFPIGKHKNPYENVFYTSLVIGVPLIRIFPLSRFGLIKNQN